MSQHHALSSYVLPCALLWVAGLCCIGWPADEAARPREAVINNENTFSSVKRFIGRSASEIEDELKEVSYTVETSGTKLQIVCPQQGKKFAPEEISAQVLRKLSADAGKYLNQTVTKACMYVCIYIYIYISV